MNCEIVRDLLPLYHDGVCSEESRRAVEEHLAGCEACRRALADMDAPLPAAEEKKTKDDAAAVKKICDEWKKGKWRAWMTGASIAIVLCMLVSGGAWILNTWTIVPMDERECAVRVYQMEDGRVGVHYSFVQATWYGVDFEKTGDEIHWFLKRPVLKTTVFNFDNKHYKDSGNMLFDPQQELENGVKAVYFDLGETSILLWKEGEAVDLPVASAEDEARYGFNMESAAYWSARRN